MEDVTVTNYFNLDDSHRKKLIGGRAASVRSLFVSSDEVLIEVISSIGTTGFALDHINKRVYLMEVRDLGGPDQTG